MMFQPLNETVISSRPRNVKEVVDILYLDLGRRDKIILASLTESELESSVYLALAKTIRKEFGLYSGNQELLDSCSEFLGKSYDEFEDPAMVIVKELWRKIQRSHTLRLIK